MQSSDSEVYLQKKRRFAKMLTIFGRKPVLEALQDSSIPLFRLHLSDSNKSAAILDDIICLAQSRGLELIYHDKKSLSRVSKNAKQDQGVALDICCDGFTSFDDFSAQLPKRFQIIALDGITNPQNLGMIIRSVCASPATAVLMPEKGCARIDALVIKASAGTVFKARLIRCQSLVEALQDLRSAGTQIVSLEAEAQHSIATFTPPERAVFVMGNESSGVSREVQDVCTQGLSIPMANGVESLNVAVAASLIAFRSLF